MAMMTETEKDAALTQFLSMTEDRVDPDVARNLLEVMNWDLQAAIEQLFGPPSPGHSHQGAMHMSRDDMAGGPLEPMATSEDGDELAVDEGLEDLGRRGHAGAGGADMDDQHLAAAIEASYRAQTHAGHEATEEELMAQALRISQQEEESRQRQSLRAQQEAELQESILMDQMREEHAKANREAEAEAHRVAEQSRLEQEHRVAAELEAKRARLPAEPAPGEPGRLALLLKLPNGQRLQRAFRATEAVSVIYDYVDLQSPEVAGQRYRLVSTMPRRAFEDLQPTLQELGIQNQCVLMVELLSGL